MRNKPHVKFSAWVLLFCFGWLSAQTTAQSASIVAPVGLPVSNSDVPAPLETAKPAAVLENSFQAFSPFRKSVSVNLRSNLAADLLKDAAEDAGEVVTAGLSLGGSLAGQLTLPGAGQAIGHILGAGLGGAFEGIALAVLDGRSGTDFWFCVWRAVGRAVVRHRAGLPAPWAAGGGLAEIFVRTAERLAFPEPPRQVLAAAGKFAQPVIAVQSDRDERFQGPEMRRLSAERKTFVRSIWPSDIHAQGPPWARSTSSFSSHQASCSINPFLVVDFYILPYL